MTYENLRQKGNPLGYMESMLGLDLDTVSEKTPYLEPLGDNAGSHRNFSDFSRLIDVCCIAQILRNFPIASLTEGEASHFIELQQFFFDLENRCLDEAGFE